MLRKTQKIVAQRLSSPERDSATELAERNKQRAAALDRLREIARKKEAPPEAH